MTFQKWAEKYLCDNGLFEDEVVEIAAKAKVDPANESMKGRWNDETTGYPPAMLNILRMALNHAAVQWIDANQPRHWARGMFV